MSETAGTPGRRSLNTFSNCMKSLQGTALDKDVPKEAEEFQQQILTVAREMSPDLRDEGNNILSELFNWMA